MKQIGIYLSGSEFLLPHVLIPAKVAIAPSRRQAETPRNIVPGRKARHAGIAD
jgi:hypothetical protein